SVSVGAGDVDDRASGPAQVGQGGVSQQAGGGDVEVEQRRDAVGRGLVQWHQPGRAGVVDHHVQASPAACHGVDHLSGGVRGAQVGRVGVEPGVFGGGFGQCVLAAADAEYVGAGAGEGAGGGSADS